MPKKKKSAPAESGKKQAVEQTAAAKQPKERPLLRAIRVTPAVLEAAKASAPLINCRIFAAPTRGKACTTCRF